MKHCLGKGTPRRTAKRLTATIVLLCCLSFLAAGRAPVNRAAAMYLITENGYLALDGQTPLSQSEDAAAAAVIGSGEDIRLPAGKPVTISRSSDSVTVTAQDETVTGLLDRMGIQAGPMDMISVDFYAAPIEINISSEMIFYEKVTETVPHSVTYISDPYLPEGTEVIENGGQDSLRTEVYEVICHNGEVTSRHLVDILEEPLMDGVVRRGVGQDAAVTAVSTNADGSGILVLEDGTEIAFSEARTMRATAYTTGDPGVGTITSTGSTVHVGTVAVDPRYIPYGTRMFIVTNDGAYVYGFAEAEDCGGAIKKDRIDLYYPTDYACRQFGRRTCTVYILDD